MTKPAPIDLLCVKAYLLVDYLLADANVFYQEQLESALESSQATKQDFCLMIQELGVIIEMYDGDTMSYEELYDNLLMSVLGQLSSMSGVFLEMWNARHNNREMDLDPIQRYLQDIVEELAEEGERIYYRLNWNDL
ncbi:uncharacterized protein RHO25_007971 [Cercospora beticola]|uniref:Uncharacterized protein n=1 Tax=Cercospora beticola TaxID=122368 RepID=A0ABZ0NV88_CERBT|nr:hypothetical protein RHO25_007971 [Cercospora beticola]